MTPACKPQVCAVRDSLTPRDETSDGNDPLWYKDAIIYELPVKSFHDGNADGIGDFQGLCEKLDFLQRLGVTCLWLLPFFPSPLKDDGYDIADYVAVHPSYGALDDFKTFLHAAHDRGLKVVIELVLNHTSDQHPWFQRARSAPPGSPERDYYVWSDTDQRYQQVRIIFVDAERRTGRGIRSRRRTTGTGSFSISRISTTTTRRSSARCWRSWISGSISGVDGFRIDAVPYLVERDGTACENLPETHAIIKAIRAHIDAQGPWPDAAR